jgi:diaminopropionate ammonia-lyase
MSTLVVPRAGRPAHPLFTGDDFARQRAFFAARPALAPTPLRSLPGRAAALGIRALWAKDETARFGLNAFKAAGTIFTVAALSETGRIRAGDTLVCASEGNHGRAVARAAREAGCSARVYLADSVAQARVDAIAAEGATVVRVHGTYDDAVREMADHASQRHWTVISDTSWERYAEVPTQIMLGYTRLMDEAEAQWADTGPPDILFVQAGVGGLLAAVASWADWRFGDKRPLLVGVEPSSAACVQVSVREGRPTTLPGPFDTVMGGLRCGEMSPVAFDTLATLVDAYVAIGDEWALRAVRALAQPEGVDSGIAAGASGAAGLGGLMACLEDPALAGLRQAVGLGPDTCALVIVSEGVTDSSAFAEALSRG